LGEPRANNAALLGATIIERLHDCKLESLTLVQSLRDDRVVHAAQMRARVVVLEKLAQMDAERARGLLYGLPWPCNVVGPSYPSRQGPRSPGIGRTATVGDLAAAANTCGRYHRGISGTGIERRPAAGAPTRRQVRNQRTFNRRALPKPPCRDTRGAASRDGARSLQPRNMGSSMERTRISHLSLNRHSPESRAGVSSRAFLRSP